MHANPNASSYLQPLLILHGLAVLVEVRREVLRVALGGSGQADLDDAGVAVDGREVTGKHVQVEPACDSGWKNESVDSDSKIFFPVHLTPNEV